MSKIPKPYLMLAALVLLVQVPLFHQACWTAPSSGELPFQDSFDRDEIGDRYWQFFHAAAPEIRDGRLWTGPLKNNALWLDIALPPDVAISFDAQSGGSVGDIKFECFGNGRDHESGYVFVFGGWNNTISIIARRDEHGQDRKERRDHKVDPAHTYRMRLVRKGGHIEWFVDGELFLEWNDPDPLVGTGHDRFAFSAWETPAFFDNLTIEAL